MDLLLGILFAALYGSCMKIADLLDEHGLKLFKGSKILFGILWGAFASLALFVDPVVANVMLADILGFIVRMRIDYRNHAIATVMVILTFIMYATFIPSVFFGFFAFFVLLGAVRDHLDDVLKKTGIVQQFFEYCMYYPIGALGYALFTNTWSVFGVISSYIVAYDLVRAWWNKSQQKN